MEKSNKKYILLIVILALTLVVIVTGVLFTARTFKAYCYNHNDAELNGRIEKIVQTECENNSIFLVSEQALKKRIEHELPSVEVVGIERIFPDAIKVNYSVKKTYAYTVSNGVYKYMSKDSKLISIDGGELAAVGEIIKVVTNEQTLDGDRIFDKDGYTADYLFTLLDIIERMGFKNAELMIEEVDFTRVEADLIVLKWRTGAYIHVEYPTNDFTKKIQLAVSAITSCEQSRRQSGVWRVYSDKISYSKN